MAAPPAQLGSPYAVWLRQTNGQGSTPLQLGFAGLSTLVPQHVWAAPNLTRDGNGQTLWEAFFFRQPTPDTTSRGDVPVISELVTLEGLVKQQQFGSRDYALRKVMDDWFFGADSTFGRPVERSKLQNTDGNGISGWGWNSTLVTLESLVPNHRFGNDDVTLRTKMLDWFFGRTAGSEDMHVLFTRGYYA